MLTLIFYLSYLSLPFFAFLIFSIIKFHEKLWRKKLLGFITIFFLLLTSLFIYSRFIETNIIKVQNTKIETGFSGKIIIIADLHLGVYKNENFIKRVVDKINKQNDIDAVLIAGDLSYYPKTDLYQLFSPLKDIKVPVYAVLGNHDCQMPGPFIEIELEKVLKSLNVTFLKNTIMVPENRTVV